MKALCVAALLGSLAAEGAPAIRRVAVIVGANSAPAGRQPLRFSHHDALSMAETLQQVAGFAAEDVSVLLDPKPAAVLQVLDERLATLKAAPGETMLIFYYSGHADDSALFPGGEPLAFTALKERLERSDATVRVGILDACRGGGWTRTKGLTPSAPFPVESPLRLASEGSVLVASSSGLEDAHETDSLQSSFFTHHLIAALRGAADRTPAGDITLQAAFAYARERTVRDTAINTRTAQHPSFDIRLRGRQDLTLATLSPGQSVVEVTMTQGPLQLIQLSSGVTLIELPEGERAVKLAVAPGRYALKRSTVDGTFAREFEVGPGATTEVPEASLSVVGTAVLARKSIDEVRLSSEQLQLGVGALPFDKWSTGVTFQLGYAHRFTRRFAWEAVRAFYVHSIPTGFQTSLERDFGVLPTALVPLPRFLVESRVAFSVLPPLLIADQLQLEAVLGAGGGVAGVETAGGLSARGTLGASVGLRIGFEDRVSGKAEFLYNYVFDGQASMHLPQFLLSLVVGLGSAAEPVGTD